MTERCV